MTEASPPARWYRSAGAVLVAALLASLTAAGAIADLVGAWGPVAGFMDGHARLGWIVAAVTLSLLAGVVTEDVKRGKRLRAAPDPGRVAVNQVGQAAEPEAFRAKRNRADLTLVSSILGGLVKGGDTRQGLADLPVDKYLTSDLARDLEIIDGNWNTATEPIYDEQLRSAMDVAKKAFNAYWHTLSPTLDAHPDIENRALDLQVIKPPGGDWGHDIEKYYAFVRTLGPLRVDFLDQLRKVDARLYELNVDNS